MKKIVLVLAILGTASGAFARGGGSSGWLLGASLNLTGSTSDDGTTKTNSSATGYDVKFGQVMGSGLYWGLFYTGSSGSTDPGTGSISSSSSGYGVSLGYFNSGWYGVLNYLLSHENTVGTTKDTKGTGYGVELGYMIPMSGSFSLLVGAEYNYVNYKEQDIGAGPVAADIKVTSTTFPKVTFGWMF